MVYRAHFAFQKYPRRNGSGLNTSATYGFVTALLEVLDKEQPTHRGVIFDTSAPTFRHKIYEPYKANRAKQPEDITMNLPWLRNLLTAMQIPVFSLDGYEADDIIGTFAKQAEAENFDVLIMSPDKDFGQLISERIALYKPSFIKKPAQKVGLAEVNAQYGVQSPAQLIDLLALQGDAVDNVPGVPGIGSKTAQKLLSEHGSLDTLLTLPATLPALLQKKLTDHRAQALLSQQLIKIDVNVPINWAADAFALRNPNKEALREALAFLEFKTLAKRLRVEGAPLFDAPLPPPTPPSASQQSPLEAPFPETTLLPTPQYHFLKTKEDLTNLLPYLERQKRVAIYLEYTADPPAAPVLRTLAFSYMPEEAYVMCLPTDYEEICAFLEPFRAFFASSQVEKIGVATKESIHALRVYGFQLEGPFFDLTLAHYLHNPEANHAFEALVSQYLATDRLPSLGAYPPAGLLAAQRATQVLLLLPYLQKCLKTGRLNEVFEQIELPLIDVLVKMEAHGVLLQPAVLQALAKEYVSKEAQLQKEIHALAGEVFNVASPKQLGEVLFDKLKLDQNPRKTKTGNYATGETILQALAPTHIIAQKVLNFREYQKLRSTYLESLPRYLAPDGRIHTQFRQTVAATGRLSAHNPNLQNIPAHTEKGLQIRKSFVAPEGSMLLSFDYAQIELRILAAFSKDKAMIAAFAEDLDIHSTMAAKIFNVSLQKVTASQRKSAKMANFGILYGISAFGLAQRLQIPRTEAQKLINTYFESFPSIQDYIFAQQAVAREQGYVETHWGRRRYLPDIGSRNVTMRAFAERNAINAPIQGTAADIIKHAMVAVAQWLKKEALRAAMVLQLHDELLFETPEQDLPLLQQEVPRLMQEVSDLAVPMRVTSKVDKSWP